MAFGKRVSRDAPPPASSRMTGNVPVTSSDFRQRALDLQQHVERILGEAASLAAGIKGGDVIEGRGFSSGLDPLSYPIGIAGFARHFNFNREGRLRHGVYAFQTGSEELDPLGQLTFFELGTAVVRLNQLCWSAYEEGGLTMALLSDAGRLDVDRVIVLAGFLAGALDTMIADITKTLRPEQAKERQLAWAQRAMAAMVEPVMFDVHYPNVGWPVQLVEMQVEDHDGQLVVNNVYLPEMLAARVRAAMVREQSKAAVFA